MTSARRSRVPGARVIGVVAAVLLVPLPGRAQDVRGCPAALGEWARGCDVGDPALSVAACPAGHALFVVGPGRLRVDVTRRPEGAFAQVGELGLSPVVQVASFDDVPRADRDAFDALVACARARPAPLVTAIAASPSAPRAGGHGDSGRHGGDRVEEAAPSTPPWGPWRAVLAAVIALAALASRHGARGLVSRALPPLALGVVVLLVRRLLVPDAYFHQNGQGPLWIAHALGEPSSYGPGYAQMFGWAATRATDPDGAVFLAQSALCALVPVATFVIVRGVGASASFGWAVAGALALSPIHARLAHGESYFATCGAMLALAAATLAACVGPDVRPRERAAGVVAAGLFVAQAALVHPVSWVAAAVVPVVVLVGPGGTAARVRLAALTALGIGAVVLAVAGLDLWEVLRGPLGAQWLAPREGVAPRGIPPWVAAACVAGIAGVVIALRSASWRRAAVATAALAGTVAIAWTADQLGAAPAWVHHANAWLYAGPAIAALAVVAHELGVLAPERARPRAGPVAAAGVLVATLAWHAATFEHATRSPTDAREAALVRAWREHLPEGAVVAHLERAGRQIVTLPLYDQHDIRLFADQQPGDLTAAGRDVFLYRSGLCTTERGRAFCEDLERTYELEPMHTATLPAIPSMRGLDYDRAEVEVVLYRVRDRRSASTTDDGSSAGREGR